MFHLPGRDAVQKENSFEVFLYCLLTGPQILHHQVCSVRHAGGNVVGISDIAETADGEIIQQNFGVQHRANRSTPKNDLTKPPAHSVCVPLNEQWSLTVSSSS